MLPFIKGVHKFFDCRIKINKFGIQKGEGGVVLVTLFWKKHKKLSMCYNKHRSFSDFFFAKCNMHFFLC